MLLETFDETNNSLAIALRSKLYIKRTIRHLSLDRMHHNVTIMLISNDSAPVLQLLFGRIAPTLTRISHMFLRQTTPINAICR
jgi:hypothetical protein